MQKPLIIIGLLILLIGLAWPWISKLGLGRLPGDLVISGKDYKLYFPLVTSLIISITATLLLWLFRK